MLASAAVRGGAVAVVGVGATVGTGELLEQWGKLNSPDSTRGAMLGASSGFVLLGAGLAFFRYGDLLLVKSGLVRNVTKMAWKEQTSGVVSLGGTDFVREVAKLPRNTRLKMLLQPKHPATAARPLLRSIYRLVPRDEVIRTLQTQAAPFVTSEKVVLERLADPLASAVETTVARSIRASQDRFMMSVFTAMVLCDLWILAKDKESKVIRRET
mmetsp:Transcript_6066/g.11292  ORF Transcript_6066/g.11292 Transcript_6066/m.11292 type:complete len:213 (-) Transcript_6066:657-1295(-)